MSDKYDVIVGAGHATNMIINESVHATNLDAIFSGDDFRYCPVVRSQVITVLPSPESKSMVCCHDYHSAIAASINACPLYCCDFSAFSNAIICS